MANTTALEDKKRVNQLVKSYRAMTNEELLAEAEKFSRHENKYVRDFGKSLKKAVLNKFVDLTEFFTAVNVILFIGGPTLATCIGTIIGTVLLLVQLLPFVLISSMLNNQHKYLVSKLKLTDPNARDYYLLTKEITKRHLVVTNESLEFIPVTEAEEDKKKEDTKEKEEKDKDVEEEKPEKKDKESDTDKNDNKSSTEEKPEEPVDDYDNDETAGADDYTEEDDEDETLDSTEGEEPVDDYDNDETAGADDYTEEDEPEPEDEEPSSEEQEEITPEEDDSGSDDYTDEAGMDDTEDETLDSTEDDSSGDIDDMVDDYTDEASDDGESGSEGDSTSDDTSTDDSDDSSGTDDYSSDEDASNDSSTQNSIVKNYNLMLKYKELFTQTSDILISLRDVIYQHPIQNQVLDRGIQNIKQINEYVLKYMEMNFSPKYETNLYHYNIFLQALRLNLEMLKKNVEIDNGTENIKIK